MVKNVIIAVLTVLLACVGGCFIAYTTLDNRETTISDSTDKGKTLSNSAKKEMSSEEKDKRISELTKDMKIEEDDMRNVISYRYKLHVDEAIVFSALIVKDNNTKKLLLYPVAAYQGETWIFFDELIFKIDNNERINLKIHKSDKTTEVFRRGGGVLEHYSVPADEDMEVAIRKIANAQNVKMRFDGKSSYKERELTPQEIKEIANVVELFDLMRK